MVSCLVISIDLTPCWSEGLASTQLMVTHLQRGLPPAQTLLSPSLPNALQPPRRCCTRISLWLWTLSTWVPLSELCSVANARDVDRNGAVAWTVLCKQTEELVVTMFIWNPSIYLCLDLPTLQKFHCHARPLRVPWGLHTRELGPGTDLFSAER